MTVYHSKISKGIMAVPILSLCGAFTIMVYEALWIGMAVILLAAAFIVNMVVTTRYIIEDHKLRIRCGFLYNRLIPVDAIKKISETRNPLSAPALSLDRLDILYNQGSHVLISPKDKAGFIAHLKTLNPGIQVV